MLKKITKKWSHKKTAVVLILVFATLLRFFKLGQVPHGMTWDEAAIGYNGQAIFTTRRDEWLQFLPVSFRSFGDYKAPLAIYLNGLFTAIFGMNLWAVRLPFALSGVLAVWGLILLSQELFAHLYKPNQPNISLNHKLTHSSSQHFSFIAGLLLASSPWHLQFTRTGFESGLALTFTIWGSYLLLKFLRVKAQAKLTKVLTLLSSTLILTAAFYTYHSAKIVIPLLLLVIVLSFKKKLKENWGYCLSASLIGLFLLYPLIKDSFWGQGLTRATAAGNTLIFAKDLSFTQTLLTIFKNLSLHLSPQFLIFGLTDSLRHSPGKWAVLLPSTLLAIVFILVTTLLKKNKPIQKLIYFSVIWLLIGLVPAAIGQVTPQANRALLALPGILWLASLGFTQVLSLKPLANHKLRLVILGFYLISLSGYLHYYYTDFAAKSAPAFNDGYLEAMQLAHQYEQGKNGRPEVDKIIFTNDYGQPYIYALFVRQTNPLWYQGGSLIKYEFKNEINVGDLARSRALVVVSQDDNLSESKADHLVYGSDGKIRFKLYLTKP